MLGGLLTLWNVLLMLAGFGLVIIVHELGHFLAARWAGIRVHAFAVGFGQAIVSWRRGLGFRRGSSEHEYLQRLQAAREGRQDADTQGLSPTEYRLNWFPFGGYVKMLGQEDLSPIVSRPEADSFAARPVWKRMVVISAGVVMNLILAGVLFVTAFTVGMREVAPVVGVVQPGSPAEKAGFEPGDVVERAAGWEVSTFSHLMLESAMAEKNQPMEVVVRRHATGALATLKPVPEVGAGGLLQIGLGPAPSNQLFTAHDLVTDQDRERYRALLMRSGLGALEPGMSLVRLAGAPVGDAGAIDLELALERSGGQPVAAVFSGPTGEREVLIKPRAVFERAVSASQAAEPFAVEHVLGLAPAMMVADVSPEGQKAGLLAGDVFARIGAIEWPNVVEGIAAIRAASGSTIEMVVQRDGALVTLKAPVSAEGRVGFFPGHIGQTGTTLAGGPVLAGTPGASGQALPASLVVPGFERGARIVRAAGRDVQTMADVRRAIVDATAALTPGQQMEIEIASVGPAGGGGADGEPVVRELSVDFAQASALRALGYEAGPALDCFRLAEVDVRASGPLQALSMGLAETRRVVVKTYLTFLRLYQGSVPVSQLQGPVGITHLGSRVVERGWVYLVFYLALISANLAVINFLPLPIVDGGHMVFLAIEGFTKKPVSAAVQNVATIAGLVLIGSMFLMVTFNDLVRLFG